MKSKSAREMLDWLESRRNKIVSRNGGWRPGDGVFVHGHRLLDDLLETKSYFQILILNATGRLVDRNLADWIESIYSCMSWPDPRIWCNQIGAMCADTQASVSAGTLAGDSKAYGQGTLKKCMEFILQARLRQEQGESARDITEAEIRKNRGKPNITGFARPLAQGDERVAAMEKITASLGFSVGKHLQLAYDIESVLFQRFGESMNLAGYMSGFLADQAFTAQDVYAIYSASVMSGVTACYNEYADQAQNSFLPLRCDDIDYVGPDFRAVPSVGEK